jgi:hypothetical protein
VRLARATIDPRTSHHLALLGVSAGVIGLCMLLTPVDDRRIAVTGLSRFPLPELCQSRVWLGIDCPGCGLTRSLIHFFHGRWDASLQMHRFGWLLALLTLLQIPYRLAALMTSNAWPLGSTFPRAVGYGLAALLSVNWILKLAGI